jgi:hypothetical protein
MRWRTFRSIPAGLALIVFGLAFYAGIGRWMKTRIVRPVDMPISTLAGHVHTGPFRINLRTDYMVIVSPGDWGDNRECNPYLKTRWALIEMARFMGATTGPCRQTGRANFTPVPEPMISIWKFSWTRRV